MQPYRLLAGIISLLSATYATEPIGSTIPRMRAGLSQLVIPLREQLVQELTHHHTTTETICRQFNAQLTTRPLPFAIEHVPLEIRQEVSPILINSYFGESTDDPLELAYKFLRMGQGIRNFSGLERSYSLHLSAICYFSAAHRIEGLARKTTDTSTAYDLYLTAAQIFYWASLAKSENPLAQKYIHGRFIHNLQMCFLSLLDSK